jgi:hypothetical protein
MKVIATAWKSLGQSGKTLGIILCENATQEMSCRIGIAEGEDQTVDAIDIMHTGGKLDMDEALGFFPKYTNAILIKKWKRQ